MNGNHEKLLNPEKSLIFRITHMDNMPWILSNGLHCQNASQLDPKFVPIGDSELIEKRDKKEIPVPPCGTLADYIPFYFTPFSIMAYNIHTGFSVAQVPDKEIVILVARLRPFLTSGGQAVFTDRHALVQTAKFYTSSDDLNEIDWDSLQRRDFKHDVDNPEKFEKYQAEALIYRHLPFGNLAGIVCYSETQKTILEEMAKQAGLKVPKVLAKRDYYF